MGAGQRGSWSAGEMSQRGARVAAGRIRPELRDELSHLSFEERQELADELYESLDDAAQDPEWERAWAAEVERRVQDVVDGRVELLDADEVHESLRAELRDAGR